MKQERLRCVCACAIVGWVCLVVGAAPGLAQGDRGEVKPRAQRTSREDQDRARALWKQGNREFENEAQDAAESLYREGLKHWRHPKIHYNLAVALIDRGELVEAYEHIVEAVRFGAAPFADVSGLYGDVIRNYRMLRGQIAKIEVVCEQKGAEVTLNGESLFTGPGKHQRFVRPGLYRVSATRVGAIPDVQQVDLLPSQTITVELRLQTLEEATMVRHRWKPWKPWAVVGTGAAVGVIGGLLYWRSGVDFAAYDATLVSQCPRQQGCLADSDHEPPSRGPLTRARREQRFAIGSFIAGGAAVVTGLTLVLLNRTRATRIEYAMDAGVSLAPVMSSRKIGLTARFSF